VVGIQIRVEKDDGDRLNALSFYELTARRKDSVLIQILNHLAPGVDAARHAHDAATRHQARWGHVLEVVHLGERHHTPRDLENVTEAVVGYDPGPGPLSGQDCV